MSITSIISSIGNNSSIYPLLVRDCCIEAPSKILIARRENLKESKEKAKDATREKFIDEYATSAIWLGGIPAVENLADRYISKKGFNPNVNFKLFDESGKNSADIIQGIEYNIKKFGQIKDTEVQDAIADLIKVRDNKAIYEKLLTKKFAVATIIPTLIMGFILPRLNFALTRKVKCNRQAQSLEVNKVKNSTTLNKTKFSDFYESKNKKLTFTGGFTSTIAGLRTVDKMAISDGGLTVGRVTTSRNKDEGYVNAFRMIGSMILNFVTPAYIAKGLDKFANKLFKVNVKLDPLILDDKNFITAIQNNKIELPKSNNPKDLLDFIDENPKSLFATFAQKSGKVSYLKSGIRDPRKFVDLKDLGVFKKEFENFVESARKSKNIENFAKKAKYVKFVNILANVGISSFLLAGVLPQLQYGFNKLVTGSYSDPGLKN